MISGAVTANGEAIICLEILGPDGERQEIEAILDTGFNGFLTLPGHIVDELRLPEAGSQRSPTEATSSWICTSPEFSGTRAANTKSSYCEAKANRSSAWNPSTETG